MSTQKPLILVDGSSFLFRAYHALPPLTNSKGMPTGAAYGVVNMMRRLLSDYDPDHIAVIFDCKEKTFRHERYPEYKANRPEMPEDLAVQIQPIHDIIRALGMPLLRQPGFEADDIIGTLAKQATEQKIDTIIVTGDKDMAQLVNEHITLVNTMSNTSMDIEGVKTKFGLPPELIIDYLALMGDTVDNVPGIPKVGPKTAVKWLTQYGSMDAIVENADKIGGKVGENLRAHLDFLPLGKELVTIHCDMELGYQIDELTRKPQETDKLIKLFGDLELKSWLKELTEEETAPVEKQYHVVLDEKTLKDCVANIKKSGLFSFDTETTSLNYMQAEVVGISVAYQPGDAYYIPVAHDYENAPQQLDRALVLSAFKPLLEDPDIKIIGQHIKYDMNVLRKYDIQLQGVAFDTMLESYVLNATATRHDMDSLAWHYLGEETIHYEEVAGKGAKQIPFNQVPIAKALPYAAEDADITLRLHQHVWGLLKDEKRQEIFTDLEMPLVPVMSAMECTGVLIDADLLKKQSEEIAARLEVLTESAYQEAGSNFNLDSPKQLQAILFEEMGLPIVKKTAKGQPSTAEDVLQELALQYALPKIILEYRSLSKLKSTYTDKLPEQINQKTGRVHTSYHQAVAATGRLSSSDPNLQNIPVRNEMGRRIRQAFIAPDGYQLISADYSQIELRIMAHLSKDKGLCDAFSKGLDVHRATAAEVFGVPLDEVTSEQRRRAKAVNFGLIYGMSAFGLAKQLDIDRNEAQNYIDIYFERYPGVHDYMESTRKKAHKLGYVETLFGRRLSLPDIHATKKMRQMAAERAAINAPMQGTAADIIKRAMLAVADYLKTSDLDAKLLMQVHDELILEVKEEQVETVLTAVKDCMQNAADLDVPLIVDAGVGNNWDEAH
ncbi:MAG: DNA polymerase [marine bacterium B5-7]|nr:MAG: DNA polymerase [marine bacterium B5-7]